jgi:hypothetical protein
VVQNKLYRAKLFDEIRFPEGKLHEDEFVIYRLLYAGKVALIAVSMFYYQANRPGSICNSPFTIRNMAAVEGARGRMLFFKEKKNKKLFNEARVAYCKFIQGWCGYMFESDMPEKYSVAREMLQEYRKYMWQILFSPSTKIRSKGGTVVRYFKFSRRIAELEKQVKSQSTNKLKNV